MSESQEEDLPDIDSRKELLLLFRDAGQDFDKRIKVLTLMDKVGLLRLPVKGDEGADPGALRVLREINGIKK